MSRIATAVWRGTKAGAAWPGGTEIAGLLEYPELAVRIVDIAGLYLAPSGRVLALELDRRHDRGTQSRPLLPINPGISGLLGEMSAASRSSDCRYRADEVDAAFRDFLTLVDRAVPAISDVYLVCLRRAASAPAASRPWLADHPRFVVSYMETETLWADEVSYCLGNRGARGLRRRTSEIETTLHLWHQTRTPQKNAFTWMRAAHNITS